MPIAIPIFFAFDALVVALVLVIWFFAVFALTRPIMTMLARLLADVPAVGDLLASAVLNLEDSIANWIGRLIRDAYDAGATPFIRIMTSYADARSGDAYSQRYVAAHMVRAITDVANIARHQVNPPTQTYVTNNTTVNNDYTQTFVDNVTVASEDYSRAAYTQLADWANGAIQDVYQDTLHIDARVDEAEQYTQDTFTSANEYAGTVAAAAVAAASLAAAAYTDAQLAVANDYTTQVRDYATATAADTRDWAQGYVGEHEKSLLDTVTTDLAATAAIATTVATAFDDFMKDCGGQLCEDGLPFIKGLGGLKKLLETGLLIGFLVDLVTDPEGAADAAVAVAETVTSPAIALYHDIFGE